MLGIITICDTPCTRNGGAQICYCDMIDEVIAEEDAEHNEQIDAVNKDLRENPPDGETSNITSVS